MAQLLTCPSSFIPSLVCVECQRPVAHECLGEVLRVLRQVINTYPLLNTVEILTAAGKLISKVKGQPELQRRSRDDRKATDDVSAQNKRKPLF